MKSALSILALASGALLTACGPTKLQVQPNDVVNVTVRPRTGQLLFCPGDPFQVEVVTKMKDGTTCSSADETRGCMGQEGVIDPELVQIRGSAGRMKDRDDLVWLPAEDVLATAGTGLDLRAWLEGTVNEKKGKSQEGRAHLKPVYQCQQGEVFHAGSHGAPGPVVEVAVTVFSTPYYPNAALIRVTVPSLNYQFHFISPSADQPLKFSAVGGSGQPGMSGTPGQSGTAGQAGPTCGNGGNGTNGTDGGNGGPGGNGGMGGTFRIVLDEEFAGELEGRVLVESVPGSAGPGGSGGIGGAGGAAGSAGSSSTDCPSGGTAGIAGQRGNDGSSGQDGMEGPAGPPPTIMAAPREKLFAAELDVIKVIEATKAKR